MKTYQETVKEILGDFAASSWLKQAIITLERRDPVDAANDAELLAELMNQRLFKTSLKLWEGASGGH